MHKFKEQKMTVANKELMRAINRDNVLRTIRVQGNITRKEIARQTGLGQSTVTDITAALLQENLLLEKSAPGNHTGRPPFHLSLNPDGTFVVGAYIAARKISVVVINLEAHVLGSHATLLDETATTPARIADLVAEAVKTCCTRFGFIPDDISGLGLGIPGLVNSDKGMIHFHPGFNKGFDWSNVPFKDLVEKRTGFQTFIENSSNTLAIFEHWFGAAQGIENFFVTTLEHGIGLGLYVNGTLVRGWQGIAGEFGHVRGNCRESVCRCGMKGCLEAEASPHAILEEAREAAKHGAWHPKSTPLTLETVIRAAQNGEQVLIDIFDRAGTILGQRLTDLTRILNPETILITGKNDLAEKMLFTPLSHAMAACNSEVFGTMPHLVFRPWREENYARGAGALVLQKLHQNCAL
ncbi:ROK family protein [Pseudodesulfovibrio sp. JC047]|uniref:ROK family transcriptional regulator n=1 Tax=Pseudodesulfovibrio sp. JC047 TaxID=2683199 RepID=UPI0013D2F403|nr:ROK family transcriptional regulator [Pseudodesulfovibrio sp. JC047]NDV18685.1 ROK family protein [Pseudodesulfovibrio sp. JC047]